MKIRTSEPPTNPFLVRSPLRFRAGLSLALASLALLLAGCWWMARGPDETLVFSREALSHQDLAILQRKLFTLQEWPHWFYSMASVSVIESSDSKELTLHEGAELKLQMDPKKGQRRKFEMRGRVSQLDPGKAIEIRILQESSGKMFRMLDQLSWKIELLPHGQATLIRGTATGHTAGWRARLFARLTPRVLMHQMFYPNLIVLADPQSAVKLEE